MKKWLILLAVLVAMGIGASKVMAGSVNVDLDNNCSDTNRNTYPITTTADPVTILINSNDNHFVGTYTVTVTDNKKNFIGSVCVEFTACGDPAQWYWGQVSFNSLLGGASGNLKVQVSEGCGAGGKVVGGQTLLVTN
jgi:hypothetical protein